MKVRNIALATDWNKFKS